jgi:hypothetical protein
MIDNKYPVTKIRVETLDSLKAKLKQAKARILVLEDRIEKRGIDAGFSINEDLLQITQTIWMHCNKLAILKKINKLKPEE